jgi:hypothetical protein
MNTPQALILALFFACLVLCVPAVFANTEQVSNSLQSSQPASIQITLSKQTDTSIRLEARAAPLGQILKAIADKTGVNIHYSVLPEAPVTATCVGENVSQIMDCLVAKQVGLVAHKPQKDNPAEFWLLGSSVGSCQAVTVMPTPLNTAARDQLVETAPTPEEQAQIDQANQEQVELLLEQLKKAKSVEQRAEAITNLASVGKIDDPNVHNALDEAMVDKDASVRVQAVGTMSFLDKDNATDYLGRALRDKSPDVRIAVVDKAGSNTDILERAFADSDANVREYAAAKLREIKQQLGR